MNVDRLGVHALVGKIVALSFWTFFSTYKCKLQKKVIYNSFKKGIK